MFDFQHICIADYLLMAYNVRERCDYMKNATVSARVEYQVKIEAEEILKNLGIPVSVVINSLYRQIIYKHGIPFSLNLPQEFPTLDSLTTEELEAKLSHSYEQSLNGEGRPYTEVFDELESEQ